MSNWKIDKPGVAQILTSTSSTAKEYEALLSLMSVRAAWLITALSKSELVKTAIGDWLDNCASPGIIATSNVTGIAIGATTEAVIAYQDGELQMAANAQSAASAAAYPTELPK
ncbi:MAG: hypothetical protein CR979_03325 [Propionibacterium sp.]|nr:MAG: hypothetical protein CR979_03325 [Propionibacterium sp.]